MRLILPIIPIPAGLFIAGGIGTLIWYYNQPKVTQDRANKLALDWFGKKFEELAESEQKRIQEELDQNNNT